MRAPTPYTSPRRVSVVQHGAAALVFSPMKLAAGAAPNEPCAGSSLSHAIFAEMDAIYGE